MFLLIHKVKGNEQMVGGGKETTWEMEKKTGDRNGDMW